MNATAILPQPHATRNGRPAAFAVGTALLQPVDRSINTASMALMKAEFDAQRKDIEGNF
jgi:hypothetical protein